jgi:hypothetical protein
VDGEEREREMGRGGSERERDSIEVARAHRENERWTGWLAAAAAAAVMVVTGMRTSEMSVATYLQTRKLTRSESMNSFMVVGRNGSKTGLGQRRDGGTPGGRWDDAVAMSRLRLGITVFFCRGFGELRECEFRSTMKKIQWLRVDVVFRRRTRPALD